MTTERPQYDRDRLGQLHPITDGRVGEIMQNFGELEAALVNPYLDKESTMEELRDHMPEVSSWSTRDRLPVVLSAWHIMQASGLTLRGIALVAWQEDRPELAMLFDDVAEGMRQTMMGVLVRASNLVHRDPGEVLVATMDFIRTNLPGVGALKATTWLVGEDAAQESLLEEDLTGNSLVDYWVKAVEEAQGETGVSGDVRPKRISAFVVRGSHVSREIYKEVYSLAKAVVSESEV
jgi:hypothetical protein